MDQTKILFNKIKGRDTGSFQLLTETYGWKLYTYIRRHVEDRNTADQIFNDTLIRFHRTVENCPCEDPIEAVLYLYADEVGRTQMAEAPNTMGHWEIAQERNFSLPEPRPVSGKKKKVSGFSNLIYWICMVLLILGIAAALWFLVGILVDMEILPQQWDLGYSWFNMHIANWF